MAHPLSRILDDAVHGRFPVPDGSVDVVGAPPDGPAALVTFTARTVIAVDIDPAEVTARLDPRKLSASMAPNFLMWLAETCGLARVGTHDAVFATLATGG